MKAALVIMAAGLGSRYGGNKQVDGVGPNGEILMEYSIYDAIRAGFTKIVFVIKPGMEEMMRRICGDYVARRTAADGSVVEVCYAVQDFTGLPAFYHLPAQREKPFGTGHAVLCARPYVAAKGFDRLDTDTRRTRADHAQFLRARIRKIDDPIPDERSPVVDAHDDGLSVPQMRDPHLGPERQQFVRGGHRIHIIAFAVGRGFSVKIPTSKSRLSRSNPL